ncbi:MAG: 4-hydroxythreonine-4-phosphate dehydrogenase PdxA [Acidobacteriota bacterium]
MTASRKRPRLAVTAGDPCGIGPEILIKALADPRVDRAADIIALGDERQLKQVARALKVTWPFAATIRDPRKLSTASGTVLFDLQNVERSLMPGQISARAGRASAEAIEAAVALAQSGVVSGVATGPINKESLSAAGYKDPGHTEMLQRLTQSKQVGMLFWADKMSVALLTTHMSLRDALRAVTKSRIVRTLMLFDSEWIRWIGKQPRIVVAGLNPHAGESGRFGLEEQREIAPAVEMARTRGLQVSGPLPADSVFQRVRAGEFDLVLALYHDQGTIPIKLACGYNAVNVTVGLPFIRTSPDHGTAMDIAGKGVASAAGLIQAILVAARLQRP